MADNTVDIKEFSLTINKYVLNDTRDKLTILCTGKAVPDLQASLSTLEFSFDGKSWKEMSVSNKAWLSNISFVGSGTNFDIEWKVKEDVKKIQGKPFMVRIQASSGDNRTGMEGLFLSFPSLTPIKK